MPSDGEKLPSLHRYFICADFMRRQFEKYLEAGKKQLMEPFRDGFI